MMVKIAGVGADPRGFTFPDFQRVQSEFKANFRQEVVELRQKYSEFAENALKEYREGD